ncbi:MAG TPA: hypothetical protein VD962_12395 [Rubricoccaceae bacterium]|nr:hypothetical protein [Rubricoccaceae bacterium]
MTTEALTNAALLATGAAISVLMILYSIAWWNKALGYENTAFMTKAMRVLRSLAWYGLLILLAVGIYSYVRYQAGDP